MRLIALLATMGALAAGCHPVVSETCARLPGGDGYCLQPSTAVPAFDVAQRVDLAIGNRTEALLVVMEVDSAGFRLVALTPFGQKLLDMNYDNQTLRAAASVPAGNLSPVMLASIVQLCAWPADAVREGLGERFVVEQTAGMRRITKNNIVLMTVEYLGDMRLRHLRLSIPAIPLTAVVRTLEPASQTEQP